MKRFSIQSVVESGVCVGCGACSIASRGRIPVAMNQFGFHEAHIDGASPEVLEAVDEVCPFSDASVDEDRLSHELFPADGPRDARLGFFLSIHAARVVEGEDCRLSSSGGLTSWLTLRLLESGAIDGVIHVAPMPRTNDGPLFEYVVSTTADELRTRRKSQYYSTSLAEAVLHVRGDGRRYALVGVPCFIKAARLLARNDEVLRDQLAVCIGLVCGHLKSSGFAELLAWQMGVPPERLSAVDFRVKQPGKPAADYAFGATQQGDATLVTRPTRSLLGGNWGHALFQLKACDYCDDVFAETADITFGDAWLPRFASDWRGTNVVVCRSQQLLSVLQAGADRGELMFEPLSAELAVESQSGNYRHRWDGLSQRLLDDLSAGVWAPRKRIKAGSRPISRTRRNIVRLRRRLASLSHAAFAEAKRECSLDRFERVVRPLTDALDEEHRMADRSVLRAMARRIRTTLATAFR